MFVVLSLLVTLVFFSGLPHQKLSQTERAEIKRNPRDAFVASCWSTQMMMIVRTNNFCFMASPFVLCELKGRILHPPNLTTKSGQSR